MFEIVLRFVGAITVVRLSGRLLYGWLKRSGNIYLRLRSGLSKSLQNGGAIVITGCTDGIGLGLTLALAKEYPEAEMILISRDADRLDKLKRQVVELHKVGTPRGSLSGSAVTIAHDFSDTRNEKGLENILSNKRVGLLINNVGQSETHPLFFDEKLGESMDEMVNVNLRTSMLLSRWCLKGMTEQKSGTIICVGSAADPSAEPLHCLYSSTKGGLRTFCESLQAETRSLNITVNCWQPGFVDTKMISKLYKDQSTVISVPSFCQYAINCIKSAHCAFEPLLMSYPPTTYSPHPLHAVLIHILDWIPVHVWNKFRRNFRLATRSACLEKKSGLNIPN